jgi:hypothetical protein
MHDGDTTGAVTAVAGGLALADSLYREVVLIVKLTAISIERSHLSLIQELLRQARLRDQDLVRLQAALPSGGEENLLLEGLVDELWLMQRHFENYLRGEGEWDVNDTWLIVVRDWLSWILQPVLRADYRYYLQHMDRALWHASLPPYRRQVDLVADPLTDRPPVYYVLSRSTIPNLEWLMQRGDQAAAHRMLARIALALARYELVHQTYPPSLAALVPEFLSEPPMDAFSGGPPDYRRLGTGYILRSAGHAYEDQPQPWQGERVLDLSLEQPPPSQPTGGL